MQDAQHAPQNVLVTGGAGFIGSNFVRHILQPAAAVRKVVAYDALTYAANPQSLPPFGPRFSLVVGDVCDEALLRATIEREECDTVVHLAAESHVDRAIDDPRPFVATNVAGTASVLNAARAAWGGRFAGRRLHVVSTDEVFGGTAGESCSSSVAEDGRLEPRNPYSATKAAADHLARAWHATYGLPVTLSHAANNYGPWQFPEKLVPLTIARALAGLPLPLYGDGRHVRDWLFVGDHCTAIDTVVRRGRLGESYNISARQERCNIDVVRAVCRTLDRLSPPADGLPRDRLITFVQDRPAHDRRYAIDASKIARELQWAPTVVFEDGIEQTVAWYLEHQDWVSEIVSGRYHLQRLGVLSASTSPSPQQDN